MSGRCQVNVIVCHAEGVLQYACRNRKEVKAILQFILTALAVLLAEVLIFVGFSRYAERKWGDADKGAKASKPLDEGRFWQNIISYDHKKGGEKD